MNIDASRIAPKLYQGSVPPMGTALRAAGFDVLVLAAEEHQPPAYRFPGVEVIHAGYDDSGKAITAREMHIAQDAATRVSLAILSGKRVIVTCFAGLNRSGLISALALYFATGQRMSGRECLAQVRANRPGALNNPSFVALLESLPAQKKRRTA